MATLGRWNRTIQDAAGNIANATVTVYKESDGLLATIYSDRAGATPKSNPFTLSDSDYGLAFFHATGGAYKIIATDGSYSQTYRYEPVGTGAEFDSDSLSGVTPPTTTVPAGIHIAEATNNGSNYVNVTVPASLTGSRTFTVPDKDVSFGTIGADLAATLFGSHRNAAGEKLPNFPRFCAVLEMMASTAKRAAIVVPCSPQAILDRRYETEVGPLSVLGRCGRIFLDYGIPTIWAGSEGEAAREIGHLLKSAWEDERAERKARAAEEARAR